MLLALLSLALVPWINGEKPPEHYCAISKNHTMCLYRKFNSMGLRCRHYHSIPAEDIKQMMLRTHNSLRNNYASQPKQQFTVPNMLGLEWDEELAEIAGRLAMQRPHSDGDVRDVERSKVVNTVGMASTESSFSNLLEIWNSLISGIVTFYKIIFGLEGEVRTFESAFKSIITNPHFKFVGCAAVTCSQSIIEDEMFDTILVCNYGPLAIPYEIYQSAGVPCTRCPDGTHCHKNSSYPNLCFGNMSSSLSNGEQIPEVPFELQDLMYDGDDDSMETEEPETPAWISHHRIHYSNATNVYGRGGYSSTNQVTLKLMKRLIETVIIRSLRAVLNLLQTLESMLNKLLPQWMIPPDADGVTGKSRKRRDTNNDTTCDYQCFNSNLTHTLCKFKSQNPGKLCKNILNHNGGLAEDMLSLHNEARDVIASNWYTETLPEYVREKGFPQASNMREMIWNEQLAEAAKKWAIQCNPKPDDCRDLKLTNGKTYIINKQETPSQDLMRVDQLVAWKDWIVVNEPPAPRDFFNDWLSELVNFSLSDIPNYVRRKRDHTEHFVQIIWARTYMIGCAMMSWDVRNGERRMFLVCNYAPLGGQHKWPVYKIGGPCTNCDPLYEDGTEGMVCSPKRLSLCRTDYSGPEMKIGTDRILLLLLMSQIIKSLFLKYSSYFICCCFVVLCVSCLDFQVHLKYKTTTDYIFQSKWKGTSDVD